MHKYLYFSLIFTFCASCLLGEPSKKQSDENKNSIALNNFYIVEKGDTIESIEIKTGVPRATIEKLNYGMNPRALRVGSKIKIK